MVILGVSAFGSRGVHPWADTSHPPTGKHHPSRHPHCMLVYTPLLNAFWDTLPLVNRITAVMIKVPVLPEYGRMLSAWQEVTNPLTSRNAEMTKLASTDDNSGNEDLK